ncbi:MAG: PilZ domain-containing protein [Erythrobacter sp.]|uniref:PilZ domain-containing protein n=1 Tax=Erythrobacter sp. TaxID=1042 RepID=UPI003A8A793A
MQFYRVPRPTLIDNDPEQIVGRRHAPRLRLSIPARLLTLDGASRCILVNLSRTGAHIGLKQPLAAGARAILQVDGIDSFGVVTRCEIGPNGGSNGFEFEEPLSDAEVVAMRQYAEGLERYQEARLRRQAEAWVKGKI